MAKMKRLGWARWDERFHQWRVRTTKPPKNDGHQWQKIYVKEDVGALDE